MKNRDIEKQLKKDAVPDIYDKILLSAQAEGLMPAQSETVEKKATGAPAKTRRNLFASLSAAFVAVAVCLAIVLPLVLGGGVASAPVSLSVNDVYAIGAVSTARLLGDDISVNAVSALAAAAEFADETAENQSDVKNQISKFNEYFSALDSFFGDDIVTTVATENTDNDYARYKIKLSISGKNFNGASVNYVMYYNETKSAQHGHHDDDDEELYTMEGVMLIDGVEHYLEGERTVETDSDEVENELKIRAYADLSDKTSYIQMEQEYSAEQNETETEYVFDVYKNGKLIEQTAVEFETERKGGKEETEYSLEFRQGNYKGKYKIERETKNGISKIKVKYDIDGDKGEFTVNEKTPGKYSYTFADGTTLTI